MQRRAIAIAFFVLSLLAGDGRPADACRLGGEGFMLEEFHQRSRVSNVSVVQSCRSRKSTGGIISAVVIELTRANGCAIAP